MDNRSPEEIFRDIFDGDSTKNNTDKKEAENTSNEHHSYGNMSAEDILRKVLGKTDPSSQQILNAFSWSDHPRPSPQRAVNSYYCRYCGSPLILIKKQRYDPSTGSPVYSYECMAFGCELNTICGGDHDCGFLGLRRNCRRCGRFAWGD